MKIHLFSNVFFEPWDWRNSVEQGIGGSETSHVEMAWRLARRGHDVVSYAPIPPDCDGMWRGTTWKRFEEADFSQPGLWVLYRCPAILDRFDARRADQPRWLMCQDTWYQELTAPRAAKLDKVLALCQDHAAHLAASPIGPAIRDRIWLTSNGVKVDLIRAIEREGVPERHPHKLVYASSPDRGLLHLLAIFARAREIVPDLELSVCYGFENIDKLLATGAPWTRQHLAGVKDSIQPLLEQPGVTWLGRISQHALYREWLSAGLWVYPTEFTETSCITCLEAQALGAIPITRPLWALRDNVQHGIWIDGSPAGDPLVRARYVGEIVRLATQPALQDRLRGPMMAATRDRCNWERWVDQWECELFGWGVPVPLSQFNFQWKHARGRILNVGCDVDAPGMARRLGAVNLDVRARNPVTGLPTAAHVLHDIRRPLPKAVGTFDTVLLGDILEHLASDDGVRALEQARAVLRPGGQVLVTVPDDAGREPTDQHVGSAGDETYAPGVSAFHTRRVTRADVEAQLRAAGLTVTHYQPIDYTPFEGHGLVAMVDPCS